MKITKEQLMKIIEEEVTVNLNEETEDDTYYFAELDSGDVSMAFPKDGRSPEEFANVIIGDLDSKGRKRTFNVYEGDPMEAASSYAIWMVKEVPEGSTWPDGTPMENVEGYPGVSSFAPEADEEEEEAPPTDPEAYLQEETTMKITNKQIKEIIEEEITNAVGALNELGMGGGVVPDQGIQATRTAIHGEEELPQAEQGKGDKNMAARALELLIRLGDLMTGTGDGQSGSDEATLEWAKQIRDGENVFDTGMTFEEGLETEGASEDEEEEEGLGSGHIPVAIEEEQDQLNEDKAAYAKWKRLL